MDEFEELYNKYTNMTFETSVKVIFEAALSEIDCAFDHGSITQKEWSKLYEIICNWRGV